MLQIFSDLAQELYYIKHEEGERGELEFGNFPLKSWDGKFVVHEEKN